MLGEKPDEPKPRDVDKLYGKLTSTLFQQEPLTKDELREEFPWGDYLDDCLNRLIEVYDGIEKTQKGYIMRSRNQEKHLRRIHSEGITQKND